MNIDGITMHRKDRSEVPRDVKSEGEPRGLRKYHNEMKGEKGENGGKHLKGEVFTSKVKSRKD
jgi:hypothetical protein